MQKSRPSAPHLRTFIDAQAAKRQLELGEDARKAGNGMLGLMELGAKAAIVEKRKMPDEPERKAIALREFIAALQEPEQEALAANARKTGNRGLWLAEIGVNEKTAASVQKTQTAEELSKAELADEKTAAVAPLVPAAGAKTEIVKPEIEEKQAIAGAKMDFEALLSQVLTSGERKYLAEYCANPSITCEELGVKFGSSKGTVNTLLWRAGRRVKQRLQECEWVTPDIFRKYERFSRERLHLRTLEAIHEAQGIGTAGRGKRKTAKTEMDPIAKAINRANGRKTREVVCLFEGGMLPAGIAKQLRIKELKARKIIETAAKRIREKLLEMEKVDGPLYSKHSTLLSRMGFPYVGAVNNWLATERLRATGNQDTLRVLLYNERVMPVPSLREVISRMHQSAIRILNHSEREGITDVDIRARIKGEGGRPIDQMNLDKMRDRARERIWRFLPSCQKVDMQTFMDYRKTFGALGLESMEDVHEAQRKY